MLILIYNYYFKIRKLQLMQCDEERLFLLLTSNYDTRVRPGTSSNFQISVKKFDQK